jgi:proton-coupled amino acid transporter
MCKGSFEESVRDCFASSLAQAVQLTISVGILFTYALQMYVPIEILWPHVQKRWGPFKYSSLTDIIFRSSLVLITCKYVTYLSFSF